MPCVALQGHERTMKPIADHDDVVLPLCRLPRQQPHIVVRFPSSSSTPWQGHGPPLSAALTPFLNRRPRHPHRLHGMDGDASPCPSTCPRAICQTLHRHDVPMVFDGVYFLHFRLEIKTRIRRRP